MWVEVGQAPADFPSATLREYDIICKAARIRDARLAWQMAQYHRFAVHQPNDMPEAPGEGVSENVRQEIERIRRQVIIEAATRKARNGN